MKRGLKCLLWSLGTVVIGSIVVAVWIFSGHGLDVQLFEGLQTGMSMSEVEKQMGRPDITVESAEAGVLWIYNRHLKFCRGIVSFDVVGQVQSTFHEH